MCTQSENKIEEKKKKQKQKGGRFNICKKVLFNYRKQTKSQLLKQHVFIYL